VQKTVSARNITSCEKDKANPDWKHNTLQCLSKFGGQNAPKTRIVSKQFDLTAFFFRIFLKINSTEILRLRISFIIYFNKTLRNTFNHTLRRPFAKFVDSPYYSEPELCGGAVTVSFSKYFPWKATHFLQAPPTSRKRAADLITSKFLASKLPFHGWKSPEISWSEIWTVWRMI
jgi:hypothetical protein